MKNLLLTTSLIVIFFFVSCNPQVKIEEDNKIENKTENLIDKVSSDDVEIIEIDGCEYIIYKSTPSDNARIGYGFMTHKGNCKNPIHYHNRNPLPTDTVSKKKTDERKN